MYFKYFGIDARTGEIRISFLQDGLFRFTQPQYLNDPLEAKPKTFIDVYGRKDMEVARNSLNPCAYGYYNEPIPDDIVIQSALTMFPRDRYGDALPYLLREEGFSSMKQYDEACLTEVFDQFRNDLNKDVGIFSLTSEPDNSVMWASYGNDYNGLIVGFSSSIASMNNCLAKEVTYDPESVGFEISMVEGTIRINGITLDEQPAGKGKILADNDLLESFLFHKTENWSYEKEFRLVTRLKNCNEINEKVFLYKVPFSLFEKIIIGSNATPENRQKIIDTVQSNEQLAHVRIFDQKIVPLTGSFEFLLIK